MYFSKERSPDILHQKIQQYLDIVGVIILEIDKNGKVQLINDFGLNLLGIEYEDIIGINWIDNFIPEIERNSVRKIFKKIISGEEEIAEFYTNLVISSNIKPILIKWHNRALKNEKGDIIGTLSSGFDITEYVEIQQKLEKNREILKITLNYSPIATISCDLNKTITNCNNAAVELFHANLEKDLVGMDFLNLFENSVQKDVAAKLENMNDDEILKKGPYAFKRIDGSIFQGELSSSMICDSQKNPIGYVSTIIDISERLKKQEMEIKNQKFQALSLMAGGIAHDLNNALMIIEGNLDLIKLDVKSEIIEEMINDIETTIENAKQSINSLMFFGKNTIKDKRNYNINKIIQSAIKFVAHGTSNIFIHELEENLPKVNCNRSQISQVITNILINADQSMPNGGKILVKSFLLKKKDIDEKYPVVKNKSRDYVVISVKDQGSGIKEEIAPFIFDPYFSTKETGTGIGLATSLSIVKNHQGYLFFKNNQDRGTTFYVLIPVMNGNGTEEKESVEENAKSKDFSKKHVLIMEDDIYIQKIIAKMMENLKISADIAANDEVCLQMFKEALKNEKPYDLVILDNVIIGGLTGTEVVQKLKEIDPNVRAVISSGSYFPNFSDCGFVGQIQKPYVFEQLKKIINDLL